MVAFSLLRRHTGVQLVCIRPQSHIAPIGCPSALNFQLWTVVWLLLPGFSSSIAGREYRPVDRALPSAERRPFDGGQVAFWIGRLRRLCSSWDLSAVVL